MTINRLLLLFTVDILGDRSHGCVVASFIINTTKQHHSLRRGVYTSLHRMCDMGWLRKIRAGKNSPRPSYRLTARGRRELEATLKELEDMARLYRRHREEQLRG